MRRARTVTATLAVLALAGSLAACGRDGGERGQERAGQVSAGPATGTITVWAMGTEGEKLPALAKDFEAANPGVKVNVTAVPWDGAHDKIASAIAGRATPDVGMIGSTWMGEFAKTGALDPTPTNFDKSAYFPGAWDSTVVDGTSYGVPWYVETRLLYYRTDLAEKAGVREPANWAELKAFVKALQEKGGAKYGITLMPPGGTGAWQTFLPFAWQQGASLTGSGGAFTLDTPQMTKAMDYFTSFFREGLSAPALQPGEMENGFIDGRIGAFFSGPWHIGVLREQSKGEIDGKFAVARMPKEIAGTSFVGGGNLAVFKESANRDSAWKFVEYLTRPEVQAKWYTTTNDLPSVRSAWNGIDDPMLKVFGDQLGDAKSPPAIPTWEQVASVIDDQLEKATAGGADTAAVLKEMQQKAAGIGTGA
ncbi:sugar ABC transporter substrate-binding protein [Thermopolyspora sp. NPDC052614]|uniref:sugar ABC transporter substrate-binding protein n=1 Tax=Thermopolyspora sp. NPDC052614 TaxID=3155682 RepID=UPI00341F558B